RSHPKAVEFDLMEPLRPRRSGLDRLAELGRDPAGGWRHCLLALAWSASLGGLCGGTLHNTRHGNSHKGVQATKARMPEFVPSQRTVSMASGLKFCKRFEIV